MKCGKRGEKIFTDKGNYYAFKESFINWVKDTFFIQKRHIEVPESKSSTPDSEKIKEAVCREDDINKEDLFISRMGDDK